MCPFWRVIPASGLAEPPPPPLLGGFPGVTLCLSLSVAQPANYDLPRTSAMCSGSISL